MKYQAGFVLVLLFLFGCAGLTQYEYRYRVFYGVELEGKEKLPTEEFSRLFYPLGSLNRAMDMFGEERFELYNFERLGQGHNYIFKFRRPVKRPPEKAIPTRHIYGIYRIKRGEQELLLAVIPTSTGLEVVEVQDIVKRHPARRQEQEIIYNAEEGEITLSFTKDDLVEQKVSQFKDNTTIIKTFKGQKQRP